MHALPLNLFAFSLLRPKVKLALGLLPLLLLLCSLFGIHKYGLPGDGKDNWAAKYIAVSTAVMIILVGQVFGWMLNAVALRIVGWSPARIRVVILESKLPESWYRTNQSQSQADSQLMGKLAEWRPHHEVGVISFVIKHGIAKLAVLYGAIFAAMALLGPTQHHPYLLAVDIVLFACVLGSVSILPLWCYREQWYRYHSINHEA